MLKIGIDARSLTNRRGIGNTVFHLLRALAELQDDYCCVLYANNPDSKAHMPRDDRFKLRLLRPQAYPIWEQIVLPLAAVQDRLDILHCPANTAPIRLSSQVKLILTIHDVMFLFPTSILPKSPSVYQRLGRLYYRWCVTLAARRADMIVTISDVSRRDILKHLVVNPGKIRVIQQAPNNSCKVVTDIAVLAAVRNKYGLREPFMLALGAVDPRKNTRRIIEAYARFRSLYKKPFQLMLVGLPRRHQRSLKRLIHSLRIGGEVVVAGFVSENDLVALYNESEMLVYPSLYEGFGLPILEAMACGTPVITSARGAIPEVSGTAALMVDPLDVDQIADGMCRVVCNPELRRDLIAKGHDQVRQFSWHRAASQTLNLYKILRTPLAYP